MRSPLVKNILAAVLGYVVMFVVSFPLFTLMWTLLGADGSFLPGSWQVSSAWAASSIVLGMTVAIAGGFSCSKLAATGQGVGILIGLVIALAILAAMPDAATAPAVRPADITMFDAMVSAEQPAWIMWLNPVIGVIAVLLGAKLEASRS